MASCVSMTPRETRASKRCNAAWGSRDSTASGGLAVPFGPLLLRTTKPHVPFDGRAGSSPAAPPHDDEAAAGGEPLAPSVCKLPPGQAGGGLAGALAEAAAAAASSSGALLRAVAHGVSSSLLLAKDNFRMTICGPPKAAPVRRAERGVAPWAELCPNDLLGPALTPVNDNFGTHLLGVCMVAGADACAGAGLIGASSSVVGVDPGGGVSMIHDRRLDSDAMELRRVSTELRCVQMLKRWTKLATLPGSSVQSSASCSRLGVEGNGNASSSPSPCSSGWRGAASRWPGF